MPEIIMAVMSHRVREMYGREADGFIPNRSPQDSRKFVDLFEELVCFMPRDEAIESDESFRQVIAYSTVFHTSGDILTYRRGPGGGEGRLHGKRSLGVGGHVSVDARQVERFANGLSPLQLIWSAAYREIGEELGTRPEYSLPAEGLLILSGTKVDRVHLGVVFGVVASQKTIDPSGEIADPIWCRPSDIDPLELEPWSRAILPEVLAGNLHVQRHLSASGIPNGGTVG